MHDSVRCGVSELSNERPKVLVAVTALIRPSAAAETTEGLGEGDGDGGDLHGRPGASGTIKLYMLALGVIRGELPEHML